MRRFTESKGCQEQRVCHACRTNGAFRERMMAMFDWDGECPYGYTAEDHPEPPPMPSVAKQAATLSSAVGRAAKRLVGKGKVVAIPEKREERMSICQSCEHFRGSRCGKCGCRLALKVALETEKCPVDKW